METPQAITWSHWPPRQRPGQAIMLIIIILLLGSLVIYWLGLTWQSGVLVTALVFSLRDFLFARSLLINRDGLSLSTPLTGARLMPWRDLHPLERGPTNLAVKTRGGSSLVFTLPEDEQIDMLDDWIKWQAAGAVDIPAHEPPPLVRP